MRDPEMDVVIALEMRFDRTPDGTVWAPAACHYSFWTRYLDVFRNVKVIARVRDVPEISSEYLAASGDRVSFMALPYYIGPFQYLFKKRKIYNVIRKSIKPSDAIILRVPGQISTCVERVIRLSSHPYAVEVVGDPYDVFAPRSVMHTTRPFMRWWMPKQMKRQCLNACAAAYVTKHALQKRYPCGKYSVGISDVVVSERDSDQKKTFTTHYSSVELPSSLSLLKFHRSFEPKYKYSIIMIGSLDQLYKAPDVLIKAIALSIKSGLELDLTIVGDGRWRAKLEEQVVKLELHNRVHFTGQMPSGDSVINELDKADLFVLPSRTEGLPRAMIEAMARGLPCIGTRVGGIPELLPDDALVPPNDAIALSSKINEVLTNPKNMVEMSIRNIEVAKEYSADKLRARRITFYDFVKKKTEEWLNHKEAK